MSRISTNILTLYLRDCNLYKKAAHRVQFIGSIPACLSKRCLPDTPHPSLTWPGLGRSEFSVLGQHLPSPPQMPIQVGQCQGAHSTPKAFCKKKSFQHKPGLAVQGYARPPLDKSCFLSMSLTPAFKCCLNPPPQPNPKNPGWRQSRSSHRLRALGGRSGEGQPSLASPPPGRLADAGGRGRARRGDTHGVQRSLYSLATVSMPPLRATAM